MTGSEAPLRAIFLAGFMGSGKSTLGRGIAAWLGWPFIDLDDEVERLAGRPIPEIFARDGEDGFRRLEGEALSEQVRACRAGEPRVLALGGGTYADPSHRETLRSTGITVWLDADAETLWERVRDETHRPLARDRDAFLRLHAERRNAYERADERLDASVAPDDLLAEALRLGWMQRLRSGG